MCKTNLSILIAGDSTASNYESDVAPRAGWGQLFHQFFSQNVTIKNYAQSGRSTKSFMDEGFLDQIIKEIQPGDYFMIQFGHNDEKAEDPSRYTEPSTSFKTNLKKYIEVAKSINATPILITPVARRKFDDDGKIIDSHGSYSEAVREVAKEENVAIIDLSLLSQNYFQAVGPKGTKQIFLHLQPGENPNYPDGNEDNTHFSEYGAKEVGKLIVNALLKLNIELKNYVINC